jgi:hypothetical protein
MNRAIAIFGLVAALGASGSLMIPTVAHAAASKVVVPHRPEDCHKGEYKHGKCTSVGASTPFAVLHVTSRVSLIIPGQGRRGIEVRVAMIRNPCPGKMHATGIRILVTDRATGKLARTLRLPLRLNRGQVFSFAPQTGACTRVAANTRRQTLIMKPGVYAVAV